MSWNIEIPWLFLIIAGFAGYFQTVTGFGLGMIVMGVAGGLGVVPLTSVAAVISLMTLINCAVALPGHFHKVHWSTVKAVAIGLVPMILLGVVVLNYLSEGASALIQILLGVVMLYGSVGLLLKPSQQKEVAKPASFTVFGGFAGFLGGLFEMAGPPLIYHYYRQPLLLSQIGITLLLLFAISSTVRTLFVIGQGQMSMEILTLTAWAFPMVAAGTLLGRRWPPPLSPQAMRRVVFTILLLIGLSLISAGLWPDA